MIINATTALFPGDTYEVVLSNLSGPNMTEAGIPISLDHVQLCPQNHGKLSKPLLSMLQSFYSDTVFRLHATCRLQHNGYHRFEASTPLSIARSYFKEMAELSSFISAPAYSLHAGRREESNLEEMKRNVLDIQSLFDCPVAVEGNYPSPGNRLLVSSWSEYRWLMDSGLYYALDMSHLNIVSTRQKNWDPGLVTALLQHTNCIEVHLSANNGFTDSHRPIDASNLPIWWDLLESINTKAVIFTESNQYRRTKTGATL